jgi:hypothetical protein
MGVDEFPHTLIFLHIYHASCLTKIAPNIRVIETILLSTKARIDWLVCLLVLANFCRFDALWPFEVASTDGSTVAVFMVFVTAVVANV